jgi:hypothetical protein
MEYLEELFRLNNGQTHLDLSGPVVIPQPQATPGGSQQSRKRPPQESSSDEDDVHVALDLSTRRRSPVPSEEAGSDTEQTTPIPDVRYYFNSLVQRCNEFSYKYMNPFSNINLQLVFSDSR